MGRKKKTLANMEHVKKVSFSHYMKRYWQFYAMMILPLIYFLLFKYVPMFGNILAFRHYKPLGGPYGDRWASAGKVWPAPFRYFEQFLLKAEFWNAFKNTLIISLENLVVNFPFPIIFAILLNELRNLKLKKFIQTVSYVPRFVSTVVVVSIMSELLSPSTGMLTRVIDQIFGVGRIYYMNEPQYFRMLYILTEMWQFTGWTAIIYLAAITGISSDMFEAARIDGASRFQQIIYITIPTILPTIMVMLILNVGHLLSLGFEKVLLMQSDTNMAVSDIIDTYVYRYTLGSSSPQYSLGAAMGLFNGIIGLILVSTSNLVSRKLTGNSIY